MGIIDVFVLRSITPEEEKRVTFLCCTAHKTLYSVLLGQFSAKSVDSILSYDEIKTDPITNLPI